MYFCHTVIYALFMTSKNRRDFDALFAENTAGLERPVAIQPYHAPRKFRIEDGKIKIRPEAKRTELITPSKGMLEGFVALADADEDKFLEYACRWGLLELCKEHREKLLSKGEPISAWRDYARFARAILNIAARLHEGEMGSDDDWTTLHLDEAGFLGWDYAAERRKSETFPDIDREKSLLASGVNTYWLESGGVQPRISWRKSRPIILSARNLTESYLRTWQFN